MAKLQPLAKYAYYLVKPEQKLFVNANVMPVESFFCKAEKVIKKVFDNKGNYIDQEALSTQNLADLGDASVWINAKLMAQKSKARLEINDMFAGLNSVIDIKNREKGAISILSKLIKGIEKAPNKTFYSIDDAIACIGDGIGSRVITKSLKKLSNNEINTLINQMVIDGKQLTYKQKDLLTKAIYQSTIKPKDRDEAYRLFRKFAQPLIEKRSKEVVDTLTLSILKNRILNEGLNIDEIVATGLFDKKLINRLVDDITIKPIDILEINNYRGKYGLPEFSNNQIRQLSDALNFNKKGDDLLVIYSDTIGLNRYYNPENLTEQAEKSIKKSGYRTVQMNIRHSNGALGEIQFRGKETNIIGEYEHIAYDLRQGKNTLGPVFNDYKNAVNKLSEQEYSKYNEYLEDCYNYYNRLELGLPAVKPKLPTRFNKILGEENLRKLHDLNEEYQKKLAKDFTPSMQYIA